MDIKITWLSIIMVLLLWAQATYAQSGPEAFSFESLSNSEQRAVAKEPPPPPVSLNRGQAIGLADRMALEYRITQERYRFYEVILLASMAVISLIVVLAFIKSNPNFQPRDMVNATGLILVIFSTIIVILLADVEVQLTAAMGVLGGIAGFLFGSFNAAPRNRSQPPEGVPPKPEPGEAPPN